MILWHFSLFASFRKETSILCQWRGWPCWHSSPAWALLITQTSASGDSKKEDLGTLHLQSADRRGINSSPLSYFTIDVIHWNWKGCFERINGNFKSIFSHWQPFPFFRHSLMQQRRPMHLPCVLSGVFKKTECFGVWITLLDCNTDDWKAQ